MLQHIDWIKELILVFARVAEYVVRYYVFRGKLTVRKSCIRIFAILDHRLAACKDFKYYSPDRCLLSVSGSYDSFSKYSTKR